MRMSCRKVVSGFAVIQTCATLFAADSRDRTFDSDWRFLRGDVPGAEKPTLNDSQWMDTDFTN